MRLLLDTQIYLWSLSDSPRLSAPVRREIEASEVVYISAASIWEACIKVSVGKLRVEASALVSGIEESGYEELPVRAAHAALVASLPPIHKDPFDRILVAQAIEEPLVLITSDSMLGKYSDLVRVVEAG